MRSYFKLNVFVLLGVPQRALLLLASVVVVVGSLLLLAWAVVGGGHLGDTSGALCSCLFGFCPGLTSAQHPLLINSVTLDKCFSFLVRKIQTLSISWGRGDKDQIDNYVLRVASVPWPREMASCWDCLGWSQQLPWPTGSGAQAGSC